MAETLPELQSVVKLVAVASAYPARAISPEFHQSHPVPVGGPKGLRMAFLYCKGMIRNPGEGLHLMPPEYMAYINATTAIFEELKAVMPGDFGQPHQVGEFLGTYLTIPERALPEFLTRQTRLYQAYDQLRMRAVRVPSHRRSRPPPLSSGRCSRR